MPITEKTLEHVFERQFTDVGENWKASCPFHTDHTPSFYVHKLEFICNCFGCGKAGPVERLAAEYTGTTVREAENQLDLKLKDKIDARRSSKKQNRGPKTYPESWLAPWKNKAHKYILNRGFNLGTLQQAETVFDHSLQRQVFPIRNRDGRLVGAVGRSTREEQPKWFFYWKCDKGQCLYIPPGSRSRQSNGPSIDGRSKEPLIIVEGVLDVLWLHQHGYENSAAFIGTKFTKAQTDEIKDITDEVIICLDNDDSGRLASEKLYKALSKSCRVRFARWPANMQNKGDICDLDKGGIDQIVRQSESFSQRALRECTEFRAGRAGRHAKGQE